MNDRSVRWRLIAATALAIALIGCSDDASSTSGTSSSTGLPAPVATSTVVAGTPQSTVPLVTSVVVGKPAPAAPPVDGSALLASSFAALASGYHFTTTVTIGDAVSVVADGDRIGTDSRLTITSNGGTVAYVITQAGSWVSTAGEAWEQLDTPPATADPIDALRTPTSVTVTGADATSTHLSVVVPAAALGVADSTDVTLQVVIAGTALQEIVYDTTVTGQPSKVLAVISPLADTTPITAPG